MVKYDYNEEIGEITLLPYDKINLKVGDKFSTREHFKHKESNKYGYSKPPVEIIKVDGDNLTVRFEYEHYKKKYSKTEFLSKKECENNLYRGKFENYDQLPF